LIEFDKRMAGKKDNNVVYPWMKRTTRTTRTTATDAAMGQVRSLVSSPPRLGRTDGEGMERLEVKRIGRVDGVCLGRGMSSTVSAWLWIGAKRKGNLA